MVYLAKDLCTLGHKVCSALVEFSCQQCALQIHQACGLMGRIVPYLLLLDDFPGPVFSPSLEQRIKVSTVTSGNLPPFTFCGYHLTPS